MGRGGVPKRELKDSAIESGLIQEDSLPHQSSGHHSH